METDSSSLLDHLNKIDLEDDGKHRSYEFIQRSHDRVQWSYEHVVETPADLDYIPPKPDGYDVAYERMSFTFKKVNLGRPNTVCETYEHCKAIEGSEGHYQGLPFHVTFDFNSSEYDEELSEEKLYFALTARHSVNDEPLKQVQGYAYHKPDDSEATILFKQPLLGYYSKKIEACLAGWKPQEVKVLGEAIINALKNSVVSYISMGRNNGNYTGILGS